jgi:hypothetical protein
MEGIEGARYHCQLCENFDMCQSCFIDQGAIHVHGQAAFSCPELDELEELDEGDEGDEGDYFDTIFAEEEDTSLDELTFQYVGNAGAAGNIHLEDENGPLERITSGLEGVDSEEEEDTPINLLFPKFAPKPKPTNMNLSQQQIAPKLAKKNPEILSQHKKKKSRPPISNQPSPSQPSPLLNPKKSRKNKKKSGDAPPVQMTQPPKKRVQPSGVTTTKTSQSEVDEDQPLRFMLGKNSPPKKKSLNGSTKKKNPKYAVEQQTSPPLTQLQASIAAPSKKRTLADGTTMKVKKQKLIPITKPSTDLESLAHY